MVQELPLVSLILLDLGCFGLFRRPKQSLIY